MHIVRKKRLALHTKFFRWFMSTLIGSTVPFAVMLECILVNYMHFVKMWSAWIFYIVALSLRWRHKERDGVSNHQIHDCLLNRLFRRRSKKYQSSASLVTGQRWIPRTLGQWRGNASIWWRLHGPWVRFTMIMLSNLQVNTFRYKDKTVVRIMLPLSRVSL